MAKSSALEMLKRRDEMLRLFSLGFEIKEITAKVASKYDVNQEAVRRDWSNRKDWMKNYLNIEDTRDLVLRMLFRLDINYEEACQLSDQETSFKSKSHMLSLKVQIEKEKRELLKYLGAFAVIKADFKNSVLEHIEKLFEEKYPWTKGNKDLFNSAMALSKARGDLTIKELMEFQQMFYSSFKGADIS